MNWNFGPMKVRILCAAVFACGSIATAHADELKLRGGFAVGLTGKYGYSLDYNTQESLYQTGYGSGPQASATYSKDNVLGNVGLDFGLQIGVLRGDNSTSDDQLGTNNCTITTFLGFITDCQDQAKTKNHTSFGEASVLANFSFANGNTELLAGLSYLSFSNNLDAEYLYSGGYENFVERNTDFSGFGVKIGARHSIPLDYGMAFNLEGFTGIYRGTRTLTISDHETLDGAASDVFKTTVRKQSRKQSNVLMGDFSASITKAVSLAGTNATLELGVNYKELLNVVDTRNYVHYDDVAIFAIGKENADVSALSGFLGVIIPLN